MVKSQIYCLSLLILLISSCAQREWYYRELTPEEKIAYAPTVRAGRAYFYQGSVPEQHQVKEGLQLDSTDAATWRELGTATVKRGIADEMEYFYGEAVKRDPAVWAGFRGYLYLYFYRDFERAIEDFNLGDQANGGVSYSQSQNHDYMRGICYYGLQDDDKAVKELDAYINTIVEEEGEEWVDVYAFLYKGLSLQRQKHYSAAIAEFDRVLKYYPNLSDCYYHKAQVYLAQDQKTLALQQIEQAETFFLQGYYHQRPYVEVLEQVYIQDIQDLRKELLD